MSSAEQDKDIDHVTGVETTAHEWDGIKELNNPLPKWWLHVFYVTIAASVVYWVLYPAWPLVDGYTRGVLGQSDRLDVEKRLEELAAIRGERAEALETASLEEIRSTPDLLAFALAQGEAAFGDNCAPCHGSGAQGFPGYPNLNDDAWLWGGTLEAIQQTLKYGIRAEHPETRQGEMLAFGELGMLDRGAIVDVVNYVRRIADLPVEDEAAAARGQQVFADNCASCHGEDATGMTALGAPNLRDAVWLYGSDYEALMTSVYEGRAGVMPHWVDRLDEVTIKSLSVYVHSLGGGQ